MRASSFRVWLTTLCLTWLAWPTVGLAGDVSERGIRDFPKLSAERDWPWWRGPSRNGIAAEQSAPTKFGDSENVVWKTPVPGRGHSSPIIVGNRIFLETADEQQKSQSVVAFDRRTGQQLWKKDISQGGFPDGNHPKNTEATPTVACDGERLFATYYHHETVQCTALDLNGKPVWQQTVGPFHPRMFKYGYAPSPTLYRGTVIISAEYDGDSAITALDRKTGKQVWRTPRQSSITFSTPVVAHVAGKDQLLISGQRQVASYDPSNGKKLWTTPGTTAATCGTMVWDGDIVIASGGFPDKETIAVKADGSGKVLWKNQQKCYEQSMLTHAGYFYALDDNGIMFCWRASDGQVMWSQRLQGPVSSSPVLAGGNIYWANERGTWYVFKPNPNQFELVAENQLGDEAFPSPAVAGNQLFIRTATRSGGQRQEFLFCIGK
ncbi:MAG TPA: PQQ-binding-like beta-propeller repeat protein [Planctomycetaceae bacterium]|nr:PQQ-binding-like beta-propeller repeat protein [Planctomycetaceae bacterium]